jgi:hypothetical protein
MDVDRLESIVLLGEQLFSYYNQFMVVSYSMNFH